MARSIEALEGLALVGRASFGGLTLDVPALLDAWPDGDGAPAPSVRTAPTPVGVRRIILSDGTHEFGIEFPVPSPEVTGPIGGTISAGARAVVARPPLGAEVLPPEDGNPPELVVWGNARVLWSEGLPFVRGLADIRRVFGPAPVLWAPRVALPHRIPFLAYLGIDLIDSTEGQIQASRGRRMDPTFGIDGPPAATTAEDRPAELRDAYRRAIDETARAARSGRLRQLVETRLTAEPALSEMLRYADRELGAAFEEHTPVVAQGVWPHVLLESHRRPAMVRFRQRLSGRYRPPPSKSVLLLVPCSRTKPYRLSRSHRRFAGALEGLAPLERLHVVSVSSPIGLVPRELEDVPPARHYDIPVTGEWEESERRYVTEGLHHLLATGAYRSVLVHLDPLEYSFLREELGRGPPATWTLSDGASTTSAPSLAALRSAAERALSTERPVSGGPLAVVREELKEVAAVQWGRDAAERMWREPVRLAGRPWFQRLTDGRTDLATLREERGLFHLTVAGARRLGPDPPLAVEVDPAVTLTGDLFVPGVRRADPGIRVGDSVVLLRAGELAGVGEAVLPGPLMTRVGHGLAVRVRHRAHGSTDTPMTGQASASERGPVV